MSNYIWQNKNWPNFYWDKVEITLMENKIFYNEGFLNGLLSTFKIDYLKKHQAKTVAREIERSWIIEGEHLEKLLVYSSVCRKLNIEEQIKKKSTPHIDGIIDVTLDAINNKNSKLDLNRLFIWHSKMFPTSISGGKYILRGQFRKDPIDVVVGEMGKERVVYSGIEANNINREMTNFITWINENLSISKFTKSAIAHLWFATIHPFEDGNGRLARAISDFVLYQNTDSEYSFYSISSEIKLEQKKYYKKINKAQTSSQLDITQWILWYLECINNDILKVTKQINNTVRLDKYIKKAIQMNLNKRQLLMINKITGDWTEFINTSKWAKICKCSQDTASRDIKDLVSKGLFKKISSGPHTRFEIIE